MSDVRKVTNKLLEMIDEGYFSHQMVAEAALSYMSEDMVADFAHHAQFILTQDYEELGLD